MQGRNDQGRSPYERGANAGSSSPNGTSKRRTMPQRPPGLARVETPPSVPRVKRPQRQSKPPRSFRRRLLIFVGVLALLGIVTFVVVFAVTSLLNGVISGSGAATTAGNFLANLQSQNYDQAYQELDATITVQPQLQPQDFKQMAAADDRCYGPVTDYVEVQGSAITSPDGNTQTFTYTVTRSKSTRTYPMMLTVKKESDGTWDITSFGTNNNLDLGPAPPPATCK